MQLPCDLLKFTHDILFHAFGVSLRISDSVHNIVLKSVEAREKWAHDLVGLSIYFGLGLGFLNLAHDYFGFVVMMVLLNSRRWWFLND